jgi:hypothetical protein
MPRLLLGLLVLIASPVSAQERCTTSAAQIVDDVFKQVLERPADPASAPLTEALATGRMTVRDLVADVAKSREHLERFFWRPLIVAVYRQVLRREPTNEEQEIAARDLMAGTQTVNGFVAHTAARAANNEQDAVRILYRRLLDRDPDPDGLRSHTEIAQRQGIEAAAQSIVASPEYRNRANATVGPTESAAFYEPGVRVMYRHLLGRDPDPDGLQSLTQLASVYGLPMVVDRMVTSREYTERYGDFAVPGRPDLRLCPPAIAPRGASPRRR